MFLDILNQSLNDGLYYGGMVFFGIMWFLIFVSFMYYYCKLCSILGRFVAKQLTKLKAKFSHEKDDKEEKTKEQS